jgi:tight adherence protein B
MNGPVAAFLLLGAVLVVLGPRRAARARLAGRRRLSFNIPGVRVSAARLCSGPVWRTVLTTAGPPSGVALLLAGPVAAAIVAVYAALAATEWRRRTRRKQAAAARSADLESIATLIADLRAGLPPAETIALGEDGDGRIRRLAGAVWRLAEQTGAPAADLLDRIASDARSADQAAAKAAAQASGAQATALLLAGLPAGGIGLGYAIGADPLTVLLRTPVGAACALLAVFLQVGGLRWSQRLMGGPA